MTPERQQTPAPTPTLRTLVTQYLAAHEAASTIVHPSINEQRKEARGYWKAFGALQDAIAPPTPVEGETEALTDEEIGQYSWWAMQNPNTAKTSGTVRLIAEIMRLRASRGAGATP